MFNPQKFNNQEFIAKLNIFFVASYLLISVLNTPFILKIFFYSISLILLIHAGGLKKSLVRGFTSYYPYLIFTIICIFSFIIFSSSNYIDGDRPKIENIVALLIYFIFLNQFQNYYINIFDLLLKITSVFLIISLPIHVFYYESLFLTASSFLYAFDNIDFSAKNTFGVYLSFLLPFSIYKLSKKFSIYNYLITLLLSVSIYYTFSRTALILSTIAILILILSRKKSLVAACVLLISSILLLLFIFQINFTKYNDLKVESHRQVLNNPEWETENINKSFTLNSSRAEYIFNALEGFNKKPFFGHGLSHFKKDHSYFDKDGRHIRNPVTHNDYAQILYELGIIGIISFLYLFYFNFKNSFKFHCNDRTLLKLNFINIFLLFISLNAINLIDHPLFWIIMALTLPKKNKVIKNN